MSSEQANVISMRDRVEARREEWADDSENKTGSGKGGGDGITSKFVEDCLAANELGDGLLYAALHLDRFIYNKSAAEWYMWIDHHWERDIMSKAIAEVEAVARKYADYSVKIGTQVFKAIKEEDKKQLNNLQKKQKRIYDRVKRLRTKRGRSNCLEFGHTNHLSPLAVRGEAFDTNPWLFGCQNGVIDLRTAKLRPGNPKDFISRASPVEWKGLNEPAQNWLKVLSDAFLDDQEVIDYMQRLFGYFLTGLTVEHFFPVWWGQGRNAKGTLAETASHVMGSLAGPVLSEMLLDQGRSRSAGAPTPEIMSLRGLRLAFASETDEGRRFSISRVKWLCGGDTLKGRHPHDKYDTEFAPTHKLLLLTNHKPNAPADDFGFWERVHLIPFEVSFVDREPVAENERRADKTIKDKLIQEASGILAWMVRGCLLWQERGLDPPAKIREATRQYRREEDILGDFIEQCGYEDPEATTEASRLYDEFKEWWTENVSKRVPSQKKFGKWMTKRYKKVKSGTYKYIGIALSSDLPGGVLG